MSDKINIFIYILIVITSLIYLKKQNKKKLISVNFISFSLVILYVTVLIILKQLNYIEIIYPEKLNTILLEFIMLLATAHIFIFSFDSKKFFGRAVSDYYSILVGSIFHIYVPIVIYLFLLFVLPSRVVWIYEMHLLFYLFLLFIQIIDEVITWNKCVIKDEYLPQVKKQFSEFPIDNDHILTHQFISDIHNFKLLDKFEDSIDELYEARVKKLCTSMSNLEDVRASKDEIASLLFKRIVNQFISMDRQTAISGDEYPYYINTMLDTLDDKQLLQLINNKYFLVNGLREDVLLELLIRKWIFITREYESLKFNKYYVLNQIIENRTRINEDDIIRIYYFSLYKEEIKINDLIKRNINYGIESKVTTVIEAICTWHNFIQNNKAGDTEIRKGIPQLGILEMPANVFITNNIIFSDEYTLEETIKVKDFHEELFWKCIQMLEYRHISGVYTSSAMFPKLIPSFLSRKINRELVKLDEDNEKSMNYAQRFDSVLKFCDDFKRYFDDFENIEKRINDILEIKHCNLAPYYEEMMYIKENYNVQSSVLNDENRKNINNIFNKKIKNLELFKKSSTSSEEEVWNSIVEKYKIIKDSPEDEDYIVIENENLPKSAIYTKINVFMYFISEYDLFKKFDDNFNILSTLGEYPLFCKAMGVRYIYERDDTKPLVEKLKKEEDINFLTGKKDALSYILKNDKDKIKDNDLKSEIEYFKRICPSKLEVSKYNYDTYFSDLQIWPSADQFSKEELKEFICNAPFLLSLLLARKYQDIVTNELSENEKIRFVEESIAKLGVEVLNFIFLQSILNCFPTDERYNKKNLELYREFIIRLYTEYEEYQFKTTRDRDAYFSLKEVFSDMNKLYIEFCKIKVSNIN